MPGDDPTTEQLDRAPGSTTLGLLTAARTGDNRALDELFHRYVPGLRLWASGRLPSWARQVSDTHDLVQETVFRVFRNLDTFDYRGEGALKAYLRQSLMNRIRNEMRRARSRPVETELDSAVEDGATSPVDVAAGLEARERYEAALGRLEEGDREVIIARVELELSYQEIADRLHRPSADAVRMAVSRALVRLAKEMGRV